MHLHDSYLESTALATNLSFRGKAVQRTYAVHILMRINSYAVEMVRSILLGSLQIGHDIMGMPYGVSSGVAPCDVFYLLSAVAPKARVFILRIERLSTFLLLALSLWLRLRRAPISRPHMPSSISCLRISSARSLRVTLTR